MLKVRPPAVAGQFYPGDAVRLTKAVTGYLEGGQLNSSDFPEVSPKAIIAPHAGYVYSGPVAGAAYAHWAQSEMPVKRVILLGPSHWVLIRGLAASSAEAFSTPLGKVPVDHDALAEILKLDQVQINDEAHRREHGLEVHLPFLQTIFKEFALVPLVVGDATPAEVAEVLDKLWGGPETVVVISSDLSHYLDYRSATSMDKQTSRMIESLQMVPEGSACGRRAINGLLDLARRQGMSVLNVDLRNSGDTAGPRDRVVGYGAYLCWGK